MKQINEFSYKFSIQLACSYGLDIAVLGAYAHDFEPYVFNAHQLAALVPFWTVDYVSYLLDKMTNLGLIHQEDLEEDEYMELNLNQSCKYYSSKEMLCEIFEISFEEHKLLVEEQHRYERFKKHEELNRHPA